MSNFESQISNEHTCQNFLVLILVIFTCFSIDANAQERFNVRFNTGLAATRANNVIENDLGYMCTGFLGDGETNATPMFISQFDDEGNALWHKQIGGAEFEIENNVFFSSNADIFRLNDTVYVHSGQTRDWDGWSQGYIMKTNQLGDTLQMIRVYSPYFQGFPYENSFMATQFVTLASDSTFLLSSNINAQETANDFMVQKISQDGEVLWQYDYTIFQEGGSGDFVNFIIPSDDGGGIVMPVILNSPLNSNKIVRLDSLGNEISILEVNQSFYSGAIADALITDDHYLMLTNLKHNDQAETVIPGLVKLNLAGELAWKTRFWNSTDPWYAGSFKYGEQLVHTSDGHYAAMGFSGFANDTCYSERAWLGKIGEHGSKHWIRYYSVLSESCNRHQLYDMRETSDGGFIMCGQSKDYTGESGGEFQEGWLIKVDEHGCLVEGCEQYDNVEEQEQSESYFKAGPIPASDFLNVFQIKALDSSYYFELTDFKVNTVESFPAVATQNTFMIPVYNYSSGSYVLSLRKDGRVLQSEKIIIN